MLISYLAEGSANAAIQPIAPKMKGCPGPSTYMALVALYEKYPYLCKITGSELHGISDVISQASNVMECLNSVDDYILGKGMGAHLLV